MALSDLTDPDAVLAAVAEFDRLGRDEFLDRYGFGSARSYFVLVEGRPYDSKPIAGAAHGHQHPALGPLGPSDFSGGEDTVARRLRALGFEIEKRAVKNPDWVVDELILALDLYLREGLLDDTDPKVLELSALLNRLPIHPREARTSSKGSADQDVPERKWGG